MELEEDTDTSGAAKDTDGRQSAEIISNKQPFIDRSDSKWTTILKINLKELSLTMNKENIDRAVARFQMIDMGIIYSSDRNGNYRIVGSLGNLKGIDLCTKNSKFKCILQVEDREKKSLLDFTYVSGQKYLAPISPSNDANIDIGSKLDITLSSMRVVYVHSFVMELIDYFWQAVLFSSPIPDNPEERGVQPLSNTENSTVSVMDFVLHCTSINLVIPVNPEDVHVIVLYLPTFNVLTEYSLHPLPLSKPAETDRPARKVATRQLHICAEGVKLYNDKENFHYVDDFTFNATVVQPLLDAFLIEKIDDRALHIYLVSRITKLKAKLTKDGYFLLTRMLYENFGRTEEISSRSFDDVNNNGVSIIQYYYGQTDILSPFFQVYCFYIDFLSLSLVHSDTGGERIIGLFLLENSKYTYKILKQNQSSLFNTGTAQLLNCWPFTLVHILDFLLLAQ